MPAIFFFLVFFLLGVIGTVFWIWMLIDCASNESDQGNNKIVWIIIILLTHLLGAMIYYFVRRPQRMAETGR
jgi:hypothetical protein